jgi:hypothetical protein
MINIWLAVRNPFPVQPFRAVWFRTRKLSQNKTVEVQISRYAFNWIELQLDLNWRGTDHAGPWFMIGLFGWQLDIRMYDRRQWNDQINSWLD